MKFSYFRGECFVKKVKCFKCRKEGYYLLVCKFKVRGGYVNEVSVYI